MWNRRRLLASLTMLPAAWAAGGRASAQTMGTMPGMAPGPMTVEACIESCWRSHVMCLETERYCLEKGGIHAAASHLALLSDCADMCEKTADSMLRRSSQHAAVCIACAQMCDACAAECEAFKDDARMLACARTCRECAGHCREMSKVRI